jgi:predicted RNase H-like HicB family nuclease
MKPKELTIRVFYSEEDEGYVAIPAWEGHMLSAFGETPEQALHELCIVIQLALEDGATL